MSEIHPIFEPSDLDQFLNQLRNLRKRGRSYFQATPSIKKPEDFDQQNLEINDCEFV